MDKIAIRQEAYQRMGMIEDFFGDGRHVPREVMALYRLLKLIYSASFEQYFAEFTWLPINAGDVNDAKQDYFGWEPVTDFEKEACDLLNQKCAEKEREARNTHGPVIQLRSFA